MESQPAMTVVMCLCIALFSCTDIDFTMESYKKAVRSGLDKIPEARQIEEVLGDADHFISYHGSLSAGNDWNTEVFLYGRYELTMQVPVRMDRKFDMVHEVLGEPIFYFSEVEKIEFSESGQIGANFNSAAERKFTAADWKKVYEAKGDFSVIGIEMKKDQPVENFEKYVQAIRRDRVNVE